MNQALKKAVYSQGSEEDCSFIIHEAGLTEQEEKLLRGLRAGKTDLDIAEEYGFGDAFKEIEMSMRIKVCTAVMFCIKTTRKNT